MSIMAEARIVALIPARSGSQRIAHKNIRELAGHPLLAYTIAAAKSSGIFADVLVSTDSSHYQEIAEYYGAEVPVLRPQEIAQTLSPDIEWVQHLLGHLDNQGRRYSHFSILRPTSPFRSAATIQRAWHLFQTHPEADSLRAVERVSQHPAKMWVVRHQRLLPLLPLSPEDKPWHSSQTQALPEVYVQNASLEIATSAVLKNGTIAGEVIVPFFSEDFSGVDVNTPKDWWYMEHLLSSKQARLPEIAHTSYFKTYTIKAGQ